MKLGRIFVLTVAFLVLLLSPPISIVAFAGDLSILLGSMFLTFGLRFVSQYQARYRGVAILLLCLLSLAFIILGIMVLIFL